MAKLITTDGEQIELTEKIVSLLMRHIEEDSGQICSNENKIKKTSRISALADMFGIYDNSDITEIGTSRMFGKLYRSELRYNVTAKEFYFYNGRYWERDAGSVRAYELAKEFCLVAMVYILKSGELDERTQELYKESYSKYSRKYDVTKLAEDLALQSKRIEMGRGMT